MGPTLQRTHRVTGVDMYINTKLQHAYNMEKQRLQNSEEQFVFHGTHPDSILPIMREGFKIGGQDIAIAHGVAYGQGIYTATGPDAPVGFAKCRSVILAKGLKGHHGESRRAGVDSWTPRADWLVFAKSDQVLPTYVVHYEDSSVHGRIPRPSIQQLYQQTKSGGIAHRAVPPPLRPRRGIRPRTFPPKSRRNAHV